MGWKVLRDWFRTVGIAFLPSIRPLKKGYGPASCHLAQNFQGYRVPRTLFLLVLFSFFPGVPFYLHRYLQKCIVYQAFRSGKFLARLSHASDKQRHFRRIQYASLLRVLLRGHILALARSRPI